MGLVLTASCPQHIRQAVDALARGDLVAFPTETVYGLGADASNEQAVARIYAAKGRPAGHPLIVHLAQASDMEHWAQDITPVARELASRFWPGPLTLILKRAPHVLDAVTGGQNTVGLRVPGHPVALELLKAFGHGVAAPSANRFGRLSPTTARHVVAELGEAVDLILDGGPCLVGLESTILDLSGPRHRVLRPGVLTRQDLGHILGEVPTSSHAHSPRVPGALPSHYAPRTPLRLVDATSLGLELQSWWRAGKTVAVLSMGPPPDLTEGRWWPMPPDPEAYGRLLYAHLREADATHSHLILVESPPATAAWEAVRDRLARAATGSRPVEARDAYPVPLFGQRRARYDV
ncbi:MAG: L-threonylcarbamoyladenylate synthase [Anaerolineae bacterium]